MLTQEEIELFYKIWYGLIWGINENRKIAPSFKRPIYGEKADDSTFEAFIKIRNLLWKNPNWIDEYIESQEFGELSEIEIGILSGWREKFVKNDFVVMKHKREYSIFMTFEEDASIYGVFGISDPISEIITSTLPVIASAILLPFKGKIIYDSFIAPYNLLLGKGMRSSIKDAYDKASQNIGIVEDMWTTPIPIPAKKKAPPKPVDTKDADVPKAMSARYMEIADFIEKFCEEKLDEEYKMLCLKALAKLCRKRHSPISRGRARTWACGIVYAIGQNNFIFDKSQPIYLKASDISSWFGLAKSTASSKAKEVSDLLDLSYMNFEFVLKDLIDRNPMIQLLSMLEPELELDDE